MAGFSTVLVALSVVGSCALYSDQSDHSAVMRRHSDVMDVMQLGAGGELKVVDTPAKKEMVQKSAPEESKAADRVNEAMRRLNAAAKEKLRLKGEDFCNVNYVTGSPKSNECPDPKTQKLIEEDDQCVEAMEMSCGCKGPAGSCECEGKPNFVLDYHNVTQYLLFDKRPKRCFLDETQDPPKWFFNPAGFDPASIDKGSEVCVQVEYINGTDDGKGCGSDEYELIQNLCGDDDCKEETIEDHETHCRQAATCLNVCVMDDFKLMKEEDQQLAPRGCYRTTDSGCMRYNPIGDKKPDPKGPIAGVPLCGLKEKHKKKDEGKAEEKKLF